MINEYAYYRIFFNTYELKRFVKFGDIINSKIRIDRSDAFPRARVGQSEHNVVKSGHERGSERDSTDDVLASRSRAGILRNEIHVLQSRGIGGASRHPLPF